MRLLSVTPSRHLALAGSLALAGCSFETPSATSGVDASDVPMPDAPVGSSPDATAIAPCSTPDPTGLVLCLELEDGVTDGVLLDSSPAGRHAIATGLAATTRDASTAIAIQPTSEIRVPESAALDRDTGYTLAVWARPTTAPAPGQPYGILDHEQQYAMLFATSPGTGAAENRCVHTGVSRYEFTEDLPVGQWSLFACTWDGTQLCAIRWTSAESHERYCHVPTLPPSATGAAGLAIGHLSDGGAAHSRFDGALDSVQLYDRALTEAQLCALAGQPAGCLPCDAGC